MELNDDYIKWCISDEAHNESYVRSIERFLKIFQVLDNNREIVSALVGPYGDMRFIQKVEVILARNSRKVLEQMFPEKSDQMDYFYAYCLNGCLGFVKTWLADKKSCTPEFAADFIYRMVVSSMRAFCETREEV